LLCWIFIDSATPARRQLGYVITDISVSSHVCVSSRLLKEWIVLNVQLVISGGPVGRVVDGFAKCGLRQPSYIALRQSELARASTRVFTWPCVPSECRPPTPTSISCSYSSAVASISALASVMLAGLHPGLVSLSKVKWAGFSTGGLLPRIGFGFTTRRSRSLAKYASVCARLHRY
jgi:hypothetical protein